ncbi:MAG: hypothetical protein R3B06_23695 [Kofleriaceae bacterium]
MTPTPPPTPALPGRADFDFLIGRWTVAHRRLDQRLVGCTAWTRFAGTCEARTLLDGQANIDDNLLELPTGPYRAASLRTFDPATGLWSIWWLDSRTPDRLDPPVVGRFVDGTGEFLTDDTFAGRPIRVRFRWVLTDPAAPRWDQAFSDDGGATWEPNWEMVFTRAA